MKLTSYLRFLIIALGFLLLPALASAQNSLKCESNDGNRQYCGNYNPDQVQFDRQISESPCNQGQTWGVDRDGLWVDRGCRAIFLIGGGSPRVEGGDRPGYPNRDDRPERRQTSLTCSSDDGHRQYCGAYSYDRVRLDHQISGSPCTEGESWGVDGQGLWVDRGCRASFNIYGGPAGRDDVRDAPPRDDRRMDDRERDRDQVREERRDRPEGEVRIWWDADPNDTWPPRGDWHGGNWDAGGACFYKDSNFGGGFFCLRRGEARESLGNYGDQISSIRVFGRARATVFDDRNFSGDRQRILTDVPDLRQYGVRQKPGHTWNNRISSIRVE